MYHLIMRINRILNKKTDLTHSFCNFFLIVVEIVISHWVVSFHQDTVPKNFRKWVKCFLWRRYGSGAGREADTAYQYQKWLQAFQQRWLCEQQKGGSTDELTLTSGDEEATVQIVDSDTGEFLILSCSFSQCV